MISSWRPTGISPLKREGYSKGLVLPHAGYMYSGLVAAQTVLSSRLRNRLIILGPNHTGLGARFSVMTQGTWETPLGNIPVDEDLASAIVASSKFLNADEAAHQFEHSIEVLLPFLKYMNQEITFVPIVAGHANARSYQTVAQEIVAAIRSLKLTEKVSIVASSDMTHYEPQKEAERKDHCAIDAILKLDPDALLSCVEQQDISMCGVVPVFIMLNIVKELGANKANLIRYMTSGETSGDYHSVVGYAGITIE